MGVCGHTIDSVAGYSTMPPHGLHSPPHHPPHLLTCRRGLCAAERGGSRPGPPPAAAAARAPSPPRRWRSGCPGTCGQGGRAALGSAADTRDPSGGMAVTGCEQTPTPACTPPARHAAADHVEGRLPAHVRDVIAAAHTHTSAGAPGCIHKQKGGGGKTACLTCRNAAPSKESCPLYCFCCCQPAAPEALGARRNALQAHLGRHLHTLRGGRAGRGGAGGRALR